MLNFGCVGWTYEPVRQGPVRRGGPISLAADRFSREKMPKWSKKHYFGPNFSRAGPFMLRISQKMTFQK